MFGLYALKTNRTLEVSVGSFPDLVALVEPVVHCVNVSVYALWTMGTGLAGSLGHWKSVRPVEARLREFCAYSAHGRHLLHPCCC